MKLVMCILGINRRPSLHAIPSTSVRKTWTHRALQNKYRLVAASIGKVAYCEPWSGSDLAAGVYAYLASRGAHVHVLAWHSWHVRETSRCLCAMASNALTTCSTRLRPSHLAAALTHTQKYSYSHSHSHSLLPHLRIRRLPCTETPPFLAHDMNSPHASSPMSSIPRRQARALRQPHKT
jgi:hypothetical protein